MVEYIRVTNLPTVDGLLKGHKFTLFWNMCWNGSVWVIRVTNLPKGDGLSKGLKFTLYVNCIVMMEYCRGTNFPRVDVLLQGHKITLYVSCIVVMEYWRVLKLLTVNELLKGHKFTLYVGCTGMEMNGLLVGHKFSHSVWFMKGLGKFPSICRVCWIISGSQINTVCRLYRRWYWKEYCCLCTITIQEYCWLGIILPTYCVSVKQQMELGQSSNKFCHLNLHCTEHQWHWEGFKCYLIKKSMVTQWHSIGTI